MSDNQDSIDRELEIKIPKRAIFIAIALIIICIITFLSWLHLSPENTLQSLSLGDVGAFLSGIFSILAFYGFIEAYLIQSKELRLQRLDLKESIKAQQGSEIALKQQSEALKAQLEITVKQFSMYLEELKLKRPIFFIHEAPSYLSSRHLNITVINLGGECILKDVSEGNTNQKGLTISTSIHIVQRLNLNSMMNGQSAPEYPDSSKFDISFFYSEGSLSPDLEAANKYNDLLLIFNYSYSGTSGKSLYKLTDTDNYINENKGSQLKLELIRHIV